MEMLRRMWNEEDGQDLIEYGLLLGIITVGAITAIGGLGPKVQTYFTNTNTIIP